MVYMHNGILLATKRNEIESSAEMSMDLESVTAQSKVKQKEENKYHILTHIRGLEKMDLFPGQQWERQG